MKISESLVKAVAVTCELTGTEITPEAARVMVMDLAQYPEPQVMGALVKCRRELKGKLTIADVISRMDDGRPGPEEAWAMLPKDESETAFWTKEMSEAYGIVCRMLDDRVASRVAFIEAYKKRVAAARDAGERVVWTPTLGHDQRQRELAVLDAVEKGRISSLRGVELLPHTAHVTVVKRIAEFGGEITKKVCAMKMLEEQ